MAKVLISIVYYGESEDIKKAVSSIRNMSSVRAGIPASDRRQNTYLIAVVYNGGDRKVLESIAEKGDVRILDMPKNVGFGAGHNAAFKKFGKESDYIVIANPDIELRSDAIRSLTAFMDDNPDVGIAVPRLTDADGNLLAVYRRDPTVTDMFFRRFLPKAFKKRDAYHTMRDADYSSVFDVPFAQGSFLVVRSDLFRECGGFDKRYFLYMEDADLCRKIRKTHRCVYFPGAEVVHLWKRGSKKDGKLFRIHVISMLKYFNKWGWKLK